MTDEKIINYLKEANLFMNYNEYFMGVVVPTIGNQVLFGAFASCFREFSGYIINQTENGIGIIPLSNSTGKPMINLAMFIYQNQLSSITIENAGLFFYKKITIKDINNQCISFKTVKNVLLVKQHKNNLQNFINRYQRQM